MSQWYFHYQVEGKESPWVLAPSEKRQEILESKNPAFVTVLDISGIPEDNDWSKTRYKGPLYFDFDSEDDLGKVIDDVKTFLGKIVDEWEVPFEMIKVWLSGGKGFHIEIPMECLFQKMPPAGVQWLPYIYRELAQKVVVDTLDLSVYSGRKGRMWRTPGVKRDNGLYKHQVAAEFAMSIETPEHYREICSRPSDPIPEAASYPIGRLMLLFDQAKSKVSEMGRGKKRKAEAANKLLEPWRLTKQHMPTVLAIMRGEKVKQGVGFNRIAMQLAIYATSVGMTLDQFLTLSEGLCQEHVSDNYRYGTPAKRKAELARMFEYMETATLYDFDPGPLVGMLVPGTSAPDLGSLPEQPESPTQATVNVVKEDGTLMNSDEIVQATTVRQLGNIRRGVFMTADGIFKKTGDNVDTLCRASISLSRHTQRLPETKEEMIRPTFTGFSFKLNKPGLSEPMDDEIASDALTSLQPVKRYFVSHALSFQGTDSDVSAILDIMSEQARSGQKVFTYPREGLGFHANPTDKHAPPLAVFLTRSGCYKQVNYNGDKTFDFRYVPEVVESSYNIDIQTAPRLELTDKDRIKPIFQFNRPSAVADLLGWFVSAHFASFYVHYFKQFPLLQVYGEAGSGKTQTVSMLSYLHWYHVAPPINSAMGLTPFALEAASSTSCSAPMILDEYKPRELIRVRGDKLPKIRDLLKASYVRGTLSNKGTINRDGPAQLATIRMAATAPVVFLTEAIEMETAILERCVPVNLSKSAHSADRQRHFHELSRDTSVVSSIGREVLEYALRMNPEDFRDTMAETLAELEAKQPAFDDMINKREAPRVIYNRAVSLHGLRLLQTILKARFGLEFDEYFEELYNSDESRSEERAALRVQAMSEVGKVISRMALMSFDQDEPHEIRMGVHYVTKSGFLELRVESCYDRYRIYCVRIHETPLFDTMESFRTALGTYGPTVDFNMARSELREQGSTSTVTKLSLEKLAREGVQAFRV